LSRFGVSFFTVYICRWK